LGEVGIITFGLMSVR